MSMPEGFYKVFIQWKDEEKEPTLIYSGPMAIAIKLVTLDNIDAVIAANEGASHLTLEDDCEEHSYYPSA